MGADFRPHVEVGVRFGLRLLLVNTRFSSVSGQRMLFHFGGREMCDEALRPKTKTDYGSAYKIMYIRKKQKLWTIWHSCSYEQGKEDE